ncbi:hypothetical protein HFP51_02955 [Parasphingopyxis sp. CP4]|uniref:hypothetical protein n=1 Tax=Parasphingopyxis sp. CP4 TaxID=2724527 RepID=UPI0015A12C2C|nr:hypothetical protein [Parasphingopyxis sp. CP4]QLC21235.1 hypothetical protein HFP51_02955 [Parasphingopyxis sp. CP4]
MLGLRSARMQFRNGESSISVTLFPMVHVGEQTFYDETFREAFDHDVALIEGVKSPVVRHLTRSYRWTDFEKLGLVLQPKPPPEDEVRSRIVRADLDTDEFHHEWGKVPFRFRIIFYALSPMIGVYRRFFCSRESLARRMSLEDLPSADETLDWNPKFEPINHSILYARDQRLIDCLAAELNEGSEKRIAIVYGARHMRAVIRELSKRRYYSADASWHRIFSI